MNNHKRKIRWVHPRFQSKVILCLFATSALVLACYVVFCLLGIWSMSRGANPVEGAILHEVTVLLAQQCLTGALLAACFAVLIGMYSSFRFAGPLLRVIHYLKTFPDRRWDAPCTLRTGDEFADLNDAVNGAVGSLAEVVAEQQSALELAGEALESGDAAATERFKGELARQRELYRRHFGPEAGGAGAEDGDESSEESELETSASSA